LRLNEFPENTLGYVFENENELDAVTDVTLAIERILMIYGTELSDAEYIATPHWSDVLTTAAKALILFDDV